MELFAYKARFDKNNRIDLENGSLPKNNFDLIYNAMISVFIILTNDAWSATFH